MQSQQTRRQESGEKSLLFFVIFVELRVFYVAGRCQAPTLRAFSTSPLGILLPPKQAPRPRAGPA
jgi:hypothetical protein